MRLAVVCVLTLMCFVAAEGRIFTRNDLQKTYKRMSAIKPAHSQVRTLNAAQRQRPIFARRGQYERQQIHVPAKSKFPLHPAPPKATPKPLNPRCSQLTPELPPSGRLLRPLGLLHCHFFNAICFCRRAGPRHVLGHYGQT
ncbi:hypothetical protein WMY93_031327 [Mugilogobius chulae]|uniref:Uncharacterized protein n=1 Tax=Mugilogobius chulae TaxID=88201 RepID=A0AAW0MIS0_9GOBI